jgi:PAS domain S-box-containing protein
MKEEDSLLLKHLFESNIIGFAITDAQGNLANCNYAFLKMLGYTQEDWSEGRIRWDKINPPEFCQLDEWITSEITTTGSSSSWEKEFFHKDGERVSALVTVAPLFTLSCKIRAGSRLSRRCAIRTPPPVSNARPYRVTSMSAKKPKPGSGRARRHFASLQRISTTYSGWPPRS